MTTVETFKNWDTKDLFDYLYLLQDRYPSERDLIIISQVKQVLITKK